MIEGLKAKILSYERALLADEVAALFCLKQDTVYKQAKRGILPHFRIGSAVRFDPVQLAKWLDDNTITGT